MAFSQRPRSPPLPHLRNTRLVLRPFPPLVKLATLSWRCSVRATARILSILGNDAVFVQRRPAILTAAPMRHRPSIDGDREMTSEVTPNEASPRETSDSQAALAPCLDRDCAPSLQCAQQLLHGLVPRARASRRRPLRHAARVPGPGQWSGCCRASSCSSLASMHRHWTYGGPRPPAPARRHDYYVDVRRSSARDQHALPARHVAGGRRPQVLGPRG